MTRKKMMKRRNRGAWQSVMREIDEKGRAVTRKSRGALSGERREEILKIGVVA